MLDFNVWNQKLLCYQLWNLALHLFYLIHLYLKFKNTSRLCESLPSLFSISSSKKAWVSDVWNLDGDGGGWIPLFSRVFNDREVELVERSLQKIQAFRVHREVEDRVIWKASRCDTFLVKSLYSILEPGDSPLFTSGSIWRASVPPKVAFFA